LVGDVLMGSTKKNSEGFKRVIVNGSNSACLAAEKKTGIGVGEKTTLIYLFRKLGGNLLGSRGLGSSTEK